MIMKKNILMLAIVLLAPTLSIAQTGQNIKEIKRDKKIILRDQQELNQFIIKAKEYIEADSINATLKIKNLHRGIIDDMEREISQTSVKINEAKKEVARSQKEVRSESREVKKDKKVLAKINGDHKDSKRDLVNSKRDRLDDIHDTRDDKRDLEKLKKRLKKQTKLKNKFSKNKKNLKAFNEFIGTLKADVIQNKKELSEDRRETKEKR